MATFNVLVSTPGEWVPPRTLGIQLLPASGNAQSVVFAIPGPPPRVLTLEGTGFLYNADGFLRGGTITGMTLADGAAAPGVPLWSATGLSITHSAFLGAVGVDLWPLLLAGNDVMIGGAGGDRFQGGAGNDSLVGNNGADRLDGGLGNDTLIGGEGNDALFGGAGNDLLDPGAGRDIIRAGAGDDVVRATQVEAMAGRGEIWDGGAGEDVLAIALATGAVLDLGQATVTGFEALRFETASRLAITAAALLPIERIELTHTGRIAGGETAGLVLRGPGVFDMSAFTVEGLAGRAFRIFVDDGDGAVVFGGEETADLANDVILGGAGNSTLYGGGGRDNIDGGGGQDLIDGGEGNDTLSGGDGNDTVLGGDGADFLNGGAGNDLVEGGDGNDLITATDGQNTLKGGAGFDVITGGANADRIEGGTESDSLTGGAGHDTILGEAGQDRLLGGDGDDSLEGGDGADLLLGNADDDELLGGAGADFLLGDAGDDTLRGDGDADRLDGGIGHDWLFGGDGNDTISGGDGDDNIVGEAGADVMNGGAGNDTYTWVQGDGDVIVDGAGYDSVRVIGTLYPLHNGIEEARLFSVGSLLGNNLNNRLIGSEFGDFLSGGVGNDTLAGDRGADTLTGGAGNDVFELGRAPGAFSDPDFFGIGPDAGTQITDFSRAAGNRDVIDLREFNFQLREVRAHGGSAAAGTITYETVGTDTLLRIYDSSELSIFTPVTDIYTVEVLGLTGAWTAADFLVF